jgi:hypothetical protein
VEQEKLPVKTIDIPTQINHLQKTIQNVAKQSRDENTRINK